ncbi:Fungal specific transcription factor domain-containing protein [Cladophialophora immunda]|nr:Fungal specific transcription factor domain-containing protein [Cladophialophora immunda]
MEDLESNVTGYRNIVEHTSAGARGGETHIYVGEAQGFRYIFQAVKDHTIASTAHYIVPAPNKASLPPDDYAFLQAKGAFDIESDELRGELITRYFEYAHPLLPVIDPSTFFRQYELEGPTRVSALLLQSMFLVASSYISASGLRRSGAPSITALKKRYYLRAKALYDFDYEADKTCLVQSLLLMGYWYGNTHDRADSWHWIGIATSLSQALGFHRDPCRSNIPLYQRRLWRRIWSCCLFRDRYLGLGMGRPTRITAEDCNVPEVVIDDLVVAESSWVDLSAGAIATIRKCNRLAPIFVRMVQLAKIIGDVLACQYRPVRSPASSPRVDDLDMALQSWYLSLEPECRVDGLDLRADGQSKAEAVTRSFLHVMYHAVVITLFKPVVFDKEPDHPETEPIKYSAASAWDRCLSSASAAMTVLTHLAENELVGYLPPEAPPALIVIVSILFLDRLWATGFKQRIATQKIDLAMLILRELEKAYFAARFIIAYFTAAFQKIGQLQEAASQGVSRIKPPPGMKRKSAEVERPSSPPRRDVQATTVEGASWTLPWVSTTTGTNAEHHNAVDLAPEWLSPDLSFLDADFFFLGE